MINVHSSGVKNMLCLKSYIEGHRIHLLGRLGAIHKLRNAVRVGGWVVSKSITNGSFYMVSH